MLLQSYREFHSDLFPDTASGEPALTAQQWLSGQDALAPKVALAPDNKSLIKRERRGALFGSSSGGGAGGGKKEEATSPVEVSPCWQFIDDEDCPFVVCQVFPCSACFWCRMRGIINKWI